LLVDPSPFPWGFFMAKKGDSQMAIDNGLEYMAVIFLSINVAVTLLASAIPFSDRGRVESSLTAKSG
jgi:hypothetical protein